jgi:hypothetical protein
MTAQDNAPATNTWACSGHLNVTVAIRMAAKEQPNVQTAAVSGTSAQDVEIVTPSIVSLVSFDTTSF